MAAERAELQRYDSISQHLQHQCAHRLARQSFANSHNALSAGPHQNFICLLLMMGNMLCSEAMKRFEPGTLDMYGAEWTSESEYRMQPDAKRYEQYERNFAAVVRALSIAALQSSQSLNVHLACLATVTLCPVAFTKLARGLHEFCSDELDLASPRRYDAVAGGARSSRAARQ